MNNLLMRSELVEASIAGRKTVTRRLVQGIARSAFVLYSGGELSSRTRGVPKIIHRPKFKPGESVYIKETVAILGCWRYYFDKKKQKHRWRFVEDSSRVARFDLTSPDISPKRVDARTGWFKRPSIYCPAWASRLTIRIESVGAEPVQAITEEEATCEGFQAFPRPETFIDPNFLPRQITARAQFMAIWDQINGPESWPLNPWVWVYRYTKSG